MKTLKIFFRVTLLFALNMLTPAMHAESVVESSEAAFHFDVVGLHEPIEHTFRFKNATKAELQITNVILTSPMTFKSARSKIAPGAEGTLTVTFGMPRVYGDYEGEVILNFKDGSTATFPVTGKIQQAIQVAPMPAFFVSTKRGFETTASLEIVGHEDEPFEILSVDHESTRFTTQLRTIEDGRRYELSLTFKGTGKSGRVTEPITIVTTSKKQPRLVLEANTLIKDRVYTFPDKIDLGTIKLDDLQKTPGLAEYLSQTLMVYQSGGTNLQVTAESNLPFVKLSSENSALKDRSQVKVEVLPEKMKPGKIESKIALRVNDTEFSRLEVPFTATIEN